METSNPRHSKTTKAIISILVALILLSAGALVGRMVYLQYFADQRDTVVVPDNLIGKTTQPPAAKAKAEPMEIIALAVRPGGNDIVPLAESENASAPTPPSVTAPAATEVKAPVIALYQGQANDNEKFHVQNMLPGDSETKYFAVRVSHDGGIAIRFHAAVTRQTKNLASALQIRVTHLDSGRVLYQGSVAQLSVDGYAVDLPKNSENETVAYYQIDVFLPTSTGNEYQAAELLADFQWSVKDTGPLIPPKTGDTVDLALYIVLAGSTLALLILLLVKRRQREEDEDAQA